MEEDQRLKANASEKSPSLIGMSLLAIMRHGSGLFLREAIDAEITAHLGRLRYERGQKFRGHRNGYQETTLDTPARPITHDRPKVAHMKGFESCFYTPRIRRPRSLQPRSRTCT
jgi:transposase-like protein